MPQTYPFSKINFFVDFNIKDKENILVPGDFNVILRNIQVTLKTT